MPWAEHLLAPLGFDWQVAQPERVNALFSGANAANLYTPGQLQALKVGAPLIQRDPNTGQFTLTIGVDKSTDLINFSPFPLTTPQVTINAQGELEFRFSSPDNVAFFRLQSR